MNQADFAKLHSVSRKTVTKWKERGWVVLDGDEVNEALSNENLKKYRKEITPKSVTTLTGNKLKKFIEVTAEDSETPTEAAQRIVSNGGDSMTFDEARRVKENYLALLNQIDYDTKSGRVVLAEEVAKVVGDNYAKARTRLLAIPSEESPRIHRLKTVIEVQDALLEVITDALESLINEWDT